MDDSTRFASQILPAAFLSPDDLRRLGLTRHQVTRLVSAGRLVRLRNGRYVRSDMHPELVRAGLLGGRLDCVSLLSTLGVFVRETSGPHLQFTPATARLPPRPNGVVAHWRPTGRSREHLSTTVVEALAQASRCQGARDAVATLDSAWHLGLVDEDGLAAVFAMLPRRYRALRPLLDRRSESGAESLMRLILRGLGADVELQVRIPGVGRVDFVVNGWLIVECDSRAYHKGWDAQKRDRARDLAAAALGYTTVRPIAEDILYRTERVLETMKSVLSHGTPQNSTRSTRPAGDRRRSRR
ncbi:type IV toxin-antitoxin system AbiEi family antitoxin domain-containing protein [Microbacterium ulmi]|uniref:DUF559 domain-containing protein n=1 Tax=Microbacterium ulmi TaxID=179095 RepID=A0A7Y2PZJ7_9MICO|nr:type IV toxin-antitoxin system AbiEi family antitoxin domain-containing protein [Microbacterium ulmi]NII70321.1 very-short-patch-repair endonuclease [Microbacterium ulmi]NNH03368.1 DUF559 domain-containing protein [Microbacterium ulmi]